jgi:arylsulfatase A-like enzyme
VSDKPAWVRALAPAKDQKMRLQHEQQIEALQAVDRAVVDVLAAAEGRGRPLYVIYTSDNGWALGAHRWTQKWCGYDECSREPLLVRGPGIEAGTVVPATQLASNVDLAVTISDWAGATPDIPVDGVSLRPLLDDPDISWNRDVLLELRGGPHVNRKHWAIRTHDGWVWTEYDNGDRELYDMNADPWQLQSLHANPAFAAKRAELAARLAPMKN